MKILICSDYGVDSKRIQFSQGSFGDLELLVRSVDVAIYNQEFPITYSLDRNNLKTPAMCFRSFPETLELIQHAGFNIACLANNHAFNWGISGLLDTVNYLSEKGIRCVGAGSNLTEAGKILYVEDKSAKTAILNFAEIEQNCATNQHGGANPLNVSLVYHQIVEAKMHADVILIVIHSGIDFQLFPSQRLVELCRLFIDFGADGVFCHHSHVVSGNETYKGKPIYYGLGNMLTNIIVQNGCYYTCSVEIEIEKQNIITVSPHYFRYNVEKQRLISVNEQQEQDFFNSIKQVSNALINEVAYNEELSKELLTEALLDKYMTFFTRSNYKLYLVMRKLGLTHLHYRYVKYRMLLLKNRWNLIRCATHRDVLELIYTKYVDTYKN